MRAPRPAPPAAYAVPSPHRAGAAEWLRVPWRHWRAGLVAALLVVAGGAAAVHVLAVPRYRVETRLRIVPVDAESFAATRDAELRLIDTPRFIAPAIATLKLARDPEFGQAAAQAEGRSVAGLVASRLSVRATGRGDIVALRLDAQRPAVAARITDAIADHYVRSRVTAPAADAARLADAFRQQLLILDADARRSGGALAGAAPATPAPAPAPAPAPGATAPAAVPAGAGDLASAEAEAAAARARGGDARGQIARGGPAAIAVGPDAAAIGTLKRQRDEAARAVAEVDQRYGAKHPQSVRAHDDLRAAEQALASAASGAIAALAQADQLARARVDAARAAQRTMAVERKTAEATAQRAATAARQAAVTRDAYDELARRAAQQATEARGPIADASVLRATIPGPDNRVPRPAPLFAVALIAALGAGAATMILRAARAPDPRRLPLLAARLGIDILAVLPRPRRRRAELARLVVTAPESAYAAAIERIGDQIFPMRHRVWAIGSALPDSGRTAVALSLARIAAREGLRVLLVDCDIRRSHLAGVTHADPAADLVAALAGRVPATHAAVRDPHSDADLMFAAEPAFLTHDPFEAGMAALLAGVRDAYDVVMLDLPPLLGLAEGASAAAGADAALLVARWGATPVPATRAALARLAASDLKVAGLVLS